MNNGRNTGLEVGYPTYLPEWTLAQLSVTGFSTVNQRELWYKVIGKRVHFIVRIYGTSNSTSFEYAFPRNLPIKFYERGGGVFAVVALNNGVRTAVCRCILGLSANVVNTYSAQLNTTFAGGTWTASGIKGVTMSGFYETT